MGLTDVPYQKSVKLYCGRCEDLYSPKSSRHGSIDGAYFGTTFPHLLFLVYPSLVPPKSGPPDFPNAASQAANNTSSEGRNRRRAREELEVNAGASEGGGEGISTASVALKAERYRPRIYGFQINEIAKLQRWQEAVRDRYVSFPRILAQTHVLRQANCSVGGLRSTAATAATVIMMYSVLKDLHCTEYELNFDFTLILSISRLLYIGKPTIDKEYLILHRITGHGQWTSHNRH